MKKEHTTREQRRALQTKRAKRNNGRNKKNRTAWRFSNYVLVHEVATRLMYRFADKHGFRVGLPSKAYIRRSVEHMSPAELQHMANKFREAFTNG